MSNKYAGRSAHRRDRKPDENGIIKITMTIRLSVPVYEFLINQAEKERRSLSTIAAIQLEAYKVKCERLGL